MNLFKKLFSQPEQKETTKIATEKNTVYSPLRGTVIPISEINDGVFSEEILGKGCGIIPDDETVYAPFDGKITTIIDTKHAIGLCSNEGLELLIHVGIDTVNMKGAGFKTFVSENETVTCGQKLLTFSKKEIASAGYSDTTAIIVANTDDFSSVDVSANGTTDALSKLLTVTPK